MLFLVLTMGIVALTSNVSAVAPNPSYGKAVVDGDYAEWDLTNDYFANMYRAFDPTKPVESKLYLRYDCTKNVMYVLVLTVDDIPALLEPQNAWVSINGVSNKVLTGNDINDGVQPDFAWVYNGGLLVGYEASFSINEGSYKIVAHVEVDDAGGAQTSGSDRKTNTAGVDLTIVCPKFTPDPSIDLEKYVSVDGGTIWWPADASPGPAVLEGKPVYFKFLVTNTGNVDLSPIELTDSMLQDLIKDYNPPKKLVPGESFEFVVGPITAQLRDGEITSTYMNTATVRGKYKDASYTHEDVAYYIVGSPAIIGNQVWQDMNGNGLQDEGEPGIDGVTVELRKCSDDSLVDTTVTAEHGRYRFAVDPEYEYYLVFKPPSYYVFTLQNQGSDDTIDSDADPATGETVCITGLAYGKEDLTWDAGLYIPPMLGGDVWDDYNADGIHSIYEPGISGVTVELYKCGETTPFTTTVTDSEGYYEFTNLVPGQCYYIKFPVITGYVYTLQDQGTDEYADSDANRLNGNTVSITLVSGQNDHSWNGGYVLIQPGTGTPGYWKTHPEAWPVQQVTVGGITYTKTQAIAILNKDSATDMSYKAFRDLVSAKLNTFITKDGIYNRDFCVSDTIVAADNWMIKYKVKFTVSGTTVTSVTPIKASSTAWKEGGPLFTILDNYNNGYLCAPHRNFFDTVPTP